MQTNQVNRGYRRLDFDTAINLLQDRVGGLKDGAQFMQ